VVHCPCMLRAEARRAPSPLCADSSRWPCRRQDWTGRLLPVYFVAWFMNIAVDAAASNSCAADVYRVCWTGPEPPCTAIMGDLASLGQAWQPAQLIGSRRCPIQDSQCSCTFLHV